MNIIEEKVTNYDGFLKIDKSFIINNNDYEYQKTLSRKNSQQKMQSAIEKIDEVETKLINLEHKLDLILQYLDKN